MTKETAKAYKRATISVVWPKDFAGRCGLTQGWAYSFEHQIHKYLIHPILIYIITVLIGQVYERGYEFVSFGTKGGLSNKNAYKRFLCYYKVPPWNIVFDEHPEKK